MNLKYSVLLFVLSAFSEAINGVPADGAPSVSHELKDLPVASIVSTPQPQISKKDNGGPVEVANSQVTVTVPEASEIIKQNVPKEVPTKNPVFPSTTTTSTTPASTTPTTTPSPATTTTTTTTAPITSTTTTPSPETKTGKWIIRNKDTNTVCIIAQMDMTLNITYPGINNKVLNTTISGPGNHSVAVGNCSKTAQSIKINWGPGHSVQINFGVNETAKTYYISGMSLNVTANVFKNVTPSLTNIIYKNNDNEFMTPLDMSYKCSKVQKVKLESDTPNAKAVVSLGNTQFEAYMNSAKSEFAAAQDCEAFDTPDIVPIAVGCALAILVLVVLVAYLIGRKRSQNSGYLSM